MNEIPWTRMICKQMEACGALVFPLVAGMRQVNGLPDRMICHVRTGLVLLEFKGAKTRVKPNQRINLDLLRRRDATCAYVVRYPYRVETGDNSLLATFDGTGRGLINTLEELRNAANSGRA